MSEEMDADALHAKWHVFVSALRNARCARVVTFRCEGPGVCVDATGLPRRCLVLVSRGFVADCLGMVSQRVRPGSEAAHASNNISTSGAISRRGPGRRRTEIGVRHRVGVR